MISVALGLLRIDLQWKFARPNAQIHIARRVDRRTVPHLRGRRFDRYAHHERRLQLAL